MDYRKFILDTLLDKYENSKHYQGESSNRRVIMYFNKKEFSLYDIEDVKKKELIHYTINDLEDSNIIKIGWLDSEKNNIIEKVYLNIDHIAEAYSLTGRIPKRDMVSTVMSRLIELKEIATIDWLITFLDDSIQYLNVKNSIPRYLCEDSEKLSYIIATLKGIENKGDIELLERVFSKRYLGNSKVFETYVRSRLITILRKYLSYENEISAEDILENVGIIKTSEDLLFYGPLKIELDRILIDYAPFIYGTSMNTDMISQFNVSELTVKKVITIENKANYIEYKKKKPQSELVVYLAGFYSPVKKLFLQKIYEYTKNNQNEVKFYHWGDIDAGGFLIFNQLRNQVIPSLKPLEMDSSTLVKCEKHCESIDRNQRKSLENLLKDNSFSVFHDTIRYMLTKGIRLEQEALL